MPHSKKRREGEKIKICVVYSKGALADKTVQKWFAKLRVGDYRCIGEEHSGRPPQYR